jgi:hypothetical protein
MTTIQVPDHWQPFYKANSGFQAGQYEWRSISERAVVRLVDDPKSGNVSSVLPAAI